MQCKGCNRHFKKGHKPTDLCLKCKHLKSKGRALPQTAPMFASKQKIVQETGNPLLDWLAVKHK